MKITKLTKEKNYYIGTIWEENKKEKPKVKKRMTSLRNFLGVAKLKLFFFFLLPSGSAALSSN